MSWKLPGLYGDLFTLDTDSTRPLLINRDPEPLEVDVPADTLVSLEIMDSGPDGIDLSATQIWIDDRLAFDAGAFQSGFDGPGSSHSGGGTDLLRVVIDPTLPFVSLSLVAVKVVSATVGGAFTLSQTYSWTVVDSTVPMLLSVQSRDSKTIRVSYAQPAVPPSEIYSSVSAEFPWGWEALTYDAVLMRWGMAPLCKCYQRGGTEPYNLWAGATLEVNVRGETHSVMFSSGDAANLHAATAAEVAAAIVAKGAPHLWAEAVGVRVWVYALDTADGATMEVVSSATQVALGLPLGMVGRRLPYLTTAGTYTILVRAELVDGRRSDRDQSVELLDDEDAFVLPPVEDELDHASPLVPGNYAITRINDSLTPCVNLTVESVTAITTSSFDISVNWEMTPSGQYRLTVSNVEDAKGNVISSPWNALDFSGWQPSIPETRDFSIWNMLPQYNRDGDASGDLWRFVACLQEVCDLLLNQIDRFGEIWDTLLGAEQYVEAMLADLGNPFPFDLSETMKRRLAESLVTFYQYKGTAQGIIAACRFFFGFSTVSLARANIDGWRIGVGILGEDTWLAPADSWTIRAFDIVVDRILTDEERDGVRWIGMYMKAAEEHLNEIVEPITPTPETVWSLGESELDDGTTLSGG